MEERRAYGPEARVRTPLDTNLRGTNGTTDASADAPTDASTDAPTGAPPGEGVLVLPCGHQFHRACCEDWVAMKRRAARCPYCREKLF